MTPNGRTLYVASYEGGTVTPIYTATNTAGAAIAVGTEPDAIAVTPNGKTAEVVNTFQTGSVTVGSLTPINTATGTAGKQIPVGSSPVAIAIAP